MKKVSLFALVGNPLVLEGVRVRFPLQHQKIRGLAARLTLCFFFFGFHWSRNAITV